LGNLYDISVKWNLIVSTILYVFIFIYNYLQWKFLDTVSDDVNYRRFQNEFEMRYFCNWDLGVVRRKTVISKPDFPDVPNFHYNFFIYINKLIFNILVFKNFSVVEYTYRNLLTLNMFFRKNARGLWIKLNITAINIFYKIYLYTFTRFNLVIKLITIGNYILSPLSILVVFLKIFSFKLTRDFMDVVYVNIFRKFQWVLKVFVTYYFIIWPIIDRLMVFVSIHLCSLWLMRRFLRRKKINSFFKIGTDLWSKSFSLHFYLHRYKLVYHQVWCTHSLVLFLREFKKKKKFFFSFYPISSELIDFDSFVIWYSLFLI
jgi:hypothetical protein